jgi:hypothetical protein
MRRKATNNPHCLIICLNDSMGFHDHRQHLTHNIVHYCSAFATTSVYDHNDVVFVAIANNFVTANERIILHYLSVSREGYVMMGDGGFNLG